MYVYLFFTCIGTPSHCLWLNRLAAGICLCSELSVFQKALFWVRTNIFVDMLNILSSIYVHTHITATCRGARGGTPAPPWATAVATQAD